MGQTRENIFFRQMNNIHRLKITRSQTCSQLTLDQKGNWRDMRHHHSFLLSFSVRSCLEKTPAKGTTLSNRRKLEKLQNVTEESEYHTGTSVVQVKFLPLGELQFQDYPWTLLLKNRLTKISLLLSLLLSFIPAVRHTDCSLSICTLRGDQDPSHFPDRCW